MLTVTTDKRLCYECDNCGYGFKGGLLSIIDVIFSEGWLVLPNHNCYCKQCAESKHIINEPLTGINLFKSRADEFNNQTQTKSYETQPEDKDERADCKHI